MKRVTRNRMNSRGFTIVELMVATTVFTVIMVTVASVLVMFANSQKKAINETAVQNVTREFVDRVAQSLQFEGKSVAAISNADGTQGYCIGTTRYSYALGRQITSSSPHAAMVDRSTIGCGGAAQALRTGSTFAGTELLSDGMRVANFNVSNDGQGLYTIQLRVVFGADDLLCSQAVSGSCTSNSTMSAANLARPDLECKVGADSRFCAASELSSTVRSRL